MRKKKHTSSPARSARSRRGHYRSRPFSARKGRWILLLGIILLVFVFFTGRKSIFQLYQLYQNRNSLLIEKERLEKKNAELKEQIQNLQNDLDSIEKLGREKYNLKKENEDVYIIEPR